MQGPQISQCPGQKLFGRRHVVSERYLLGWPSLVMNPQRNGLNEQHLTACARALRSKELEIATFPCPASPLAGTALYYGPKASRARQDCFLGLLFCKGALCMVPYTIAISRYIVL
eukprot:992936-Pelagomonas_calceolata.AAC.2